MSVYKREDTYHYEFVSRGTRHRGTTGAKTKAKALEFEKKVKDDLYDQEALGRPREMTFDESVDGYTKAVLMQKPKNPDGTIKSGVKNDLLRIKRLEEHFGTATPVSKVASPAAVSGLTSTLLETMKGGGANRYLSTLRAILNKAHKDGGLIKQPKVPSLKVDDAREWFLSEEQEASLLDACPDYLRNIVTFYLDTGARKTEALWLTWADVDFERKSRPMVRLTVTKGSKPRSIPLPQRTADLLREMKKTRPIHIEKVFVWQADRPVNNNKGDILVKKGEWAAMGNFSKAWNTARKEARLDGLRVQDLRHTYASKLVRREVPIFDVSKLLGHKSIQMTMRYAHLAPDHLDGAVSALD